MMVVISMTKGCCCLCRYWEKSQFAKKTGFFPSSTSCSLFGRSFCFLNRLHAIEHYYNMNLITTKDKMLMSWHEMASCVWSQWEALLSFGSKATYYGDEMTARIAIKKWLTTIISGGFFSFFFPIIKENFASVKSSRRRYYFPLF